MGRRGRWGGGEKGEEGEVGRRGDEQGVQTNVNATLSVCKSVRVWCSIRLWVMREYCHHV